MPLKREWIVPGKRVITPNGYGNILTIDDGRCIVKHEEEMPSIQEMDYTFGQLALDTDFTVIRMLNVTAIGLVSSAVNYPSWDHALQALENIPYIQDETYLALNFQTRKMVCNRLLGFLMPIEILETYYDMHFHPFSWYFDDLEGASEMWSNQVDGLSGTTDHILLFTMLDLEKMEILSRAVFTCMRVIKKETYF